MYLNGILDDAASNSVPYGMLFFGSFLQATNGPTYVGSNSGVGAKVKLDNREVTISCPAIDTPASYSKGLIDADHPTGQWAHVRSVSDGSLQTDSVATYTTADWAAGGAWIATATLNANTPGFTNPSYAWSSDFNPSQMVGESLTSQSVNGSWFIGTVDKLPVTKTIRVDVQDGPTSQYPATAANTYSIKWHQPFEQWKDCQPASNEEIDLIAGTPQSGIPLAQIAYQDQVFHCDFSYGPNQMADGIETVQKILPVTQPFFSPIWQSLITTVGQPFDQALLGVTISHDVVNDADAFTEAKYVTTIGRETLVPLDANGVIGPDSEYGMTAGLLSAHYVRRFLQGDAYDVHGYAGPSPTKTARTVFKVQATGQYAVVGVVNLPK